MIPALYLVIPVVVIILLILALNKAKKAITGTALTAIRSSEPMFSKDTPLWLPEGTISALLVGGLTYALVFIMIKFTVLNQEIPQSVASMMDKLLPAIVLLIQSYINERKEQHKAEREERTDIREDKKGGG